MWRKPTSTGIGMLLTLGILLLGMAEVGVPEETSEEDDAIESLRYRAAQGDTSAQMELADRYDLGDGVPRDEIEAAKWIRRAAEKGDIAAQMKLGTLYDLGRGVLRDLEEAGKWVRRAAEQGSPSGQLAPGHDVHGGQGSAP